MSFDIELRKRQIAEYTEKRLAELERIKTNLAAARVKELLEAEEEEPAEPEPEEADDDEKALDPRMPTKREENVVSATYQLMAEDFPRHLAKHIAPHLEELRQDLQGQLLVEIGHQLQRIIDRKLDDLRGELAGVVSDLEARLQESLEEGEDNALQGLEALREILQSVPLLAERPPRRTRKTIEYDPATMRPAAIVEEEIP